MVLVRALLYSRLRSSLQFSHTHSIMEQVQFKDCENGTFGPVQELTCVYTDAELYR